MSTAHHIADSRPSIVKDALYGLLSATIIGLITSLTFIMLVLFLSSQAFANSNSNALFPASENLTAPMERGYFLASNGKGEGLAQGIQSVNLIVENSNQV